MAPRGARMATPVVHCEVCAGRRVHAVRRDPPGVALWACPDCGDAKRWCPRCDQGWIRRLTAPELPTDLYSCAECDATWSRVTDIVPPGTELTSYLAAHHPAVSPRALRLCRERAADLGAI